MFWALLAHHQGAHNCTQQLELVCCNIIVILMKLCALVGSSCGN
jgi:hypothetical protein